MDGGSYTLAARHSLAIAVWSLVACAFVYGFAGVTRRPLGLLAVLAALGFCLFVAASTLWAASPEAAFIEFDRALLYVGVGVLAALTPRRWIVVWADGCALGVGIVAVLSLTSRFFPSALGGHDLPHFLPGTAERLSYPLDYWNGLAVLLAIGTPLLLRAAVIGSPRWRMSAAAVLPALVCATYLTASRTGAVTLLIATAVFITLAADRWAALATTCLTGVASALAIVVLVDRPLLVNGPLDAAGFAAEGREAAVLIALICAGTGLLNAVLQKRLGALPRPSVRVGVAVATVTLAAGVALVAVSHPREKLAAFTRPPTLATVSQPNFVQAHLLSAGGGGRWQFWRAAVAEFKGRPLLGQGAGSYESWWAEHGTLPVFVRYAHSLYLETLAELGLAGLVLLVGVLAFAVFSGATALLRARERERTTIAAVLAAATAYLVAAGVDWMWQLTAVSVVGVLCLGLLAGAGLRSGSGGTRRARRPFPRAVVVAGALVVIACEALPLLTDAELRASQAAASIGDSAQARRHARAAVALEPWAVSPYVQLALVEEQDGRLRSAATAIHAALRHNERDWRSWLIAARIETKRGAIDKAKHSLMQAKQLNPRSPIFASERDNGASR
jgi:hypothetical protein